MRSLRKIVYGLGLLLLLCSTATQAQLRLAGSPMATYIDNEGEPARLNAIVAEAFSRMQEPLNLQVMRPAFLGSAISMGKVDGNFAFINLDEPKADKVYSEPYLPIYLYVASKYEDAQKIKLLPHIDDKRVAIDNRFINTDQMRMLKAVKWSRNPTALDVFRQVGEDRTRYIMAPRLLLDEFNRMLRNDNEEQLFLSQLPLIMSGFSLSLRSYTPNAEQILTNFNETIAVMQQDGTYNRLLGVEWLSKDIDNDGVGEIIGNAELVAINPTENLTQIYPLDNAKVSEFSRVYINGSEVTAEQLSEALQANQNNSKTERESLLDKEVYERILKRW